MTEEINVRNSFAGNLPRELEAAKFLQLRDAIAENFAVDPQIYRAGRYGLGPHTAQLLRDAGRRDRQFGACASSITARGHGPDYRRHPLDPYWTDGPGSVLELPLTTVFWGMLRKQGRCALSALAKHPRARAMLAKPGCWNGYR